MSGKCSVVLMYEGYPKPMPVGLTDDTRLKILLKHQLINEAVEAVRQAENLGDEVVLSSFQSDLDKLRNILGLLIPLKLEELYMTGPAPDGREQ